MHSIVATMRVPLIDADADGRESFDVANLLQVAGGESRADPYTGIKALLYARAGGGNPLLSR